MFWQRCSLTAIGPLLRSLSARSSHRVRNGGKGACFGHVPGTVPGTCPLPPGDAGSTRWQYRRVAARVSIRPEQPDDYPAVEAVVRAAFVRHPDEVALLVERIRASTSYVPGL